MRSGVTILVATLEEDRWLRADCAPTDQKRRIPSPGGEQSKMERATIEPSQQSEQRRVSKAEGMGLN
jgi:hypothetical protein